MAKSPRKPRLPKGTKKVVNEGYEEIPVDSLQPHPKNPRKGNVEIIKGSIAANGFYGAVVVQRSTYFILAGNHRYMAAKAAGFETVPAIFVDVDDATAMRILLADNRTSDVAAYDDQALSELLSELRANDDLFGTGYDSTDVDALLESIGVEVLPPAALTDPDYAPPKAEGFPTAKKGDLWQLGPHLLLCGDSTDASSWERIMQGEHADMVWTDPPYGVSYTGGAGAGNRKKIATDDLQAEQLTEFLREALTNAYTWTRPGACWYVASPSGTAFLSFAQVLTELKVWRQTVVWVKDALVLGRSDYHYRHESIFWGHTPGGAPMSLPPEEVADTEFVERQEAMLYGWTPGAGHVRPPDRKQDTVWNCARPKTSVDHPTQKPIELITRALRNNTNKGDLVVDGFGGSGSTLLACHAMERRARLIEFDEGYVDVICRRYKEHSGIEPVLLSNQ